MEVKLTKEEIANLKVQHGCSIYELNVPLIDEPGGPVATMYLKKLTRPVYEIVQKAIAKSELDAAIIMINSLWVAGDDRKLITESEDVDVLRCAANTLVPMLTARTGELKKN